MIFFLFFFCKNFEDLIFDYLAEAFVGNINQNAKFEVNDFKGVGTVGI